MECEEKLWMRFENKRRERERKRENQEGRKGKEIGDVQAMANCSPEISTTLFLVVSCLVVVVHRPLVVLRWHRKVAEGALRLGTVLDVLRKVARPAHCGLAFVNWSLRWQVLQTVTVNTNGVVHRGEVLVGGERVLRGGLRKLRLGLGLLKGGQFGLSWGWSGHRSSHLLRRSSSSNDRRQSAAKVLHLPLLLLATLVAVGAYLNSAEEKILKKERER